MFAVGIAGYGTYPYSCNNRMQGRAFPPAYGYAVFSQDFNKRNTLLTMAYDLPGKGFTAVFNKAIPAITCSRSGCALLCGYAGADMRTFLFRKNCIGNVDESSAVKRV